MDTITAIELILIAILAVLVVIGIAVGMRNKRRRLAAEEEIAEHEKLVAEATGEQPAEPPPETDGKIEEPEQKALADELDSEPVAEPAPRKASAAKEAPAPATPPSLAPKPARTLTATPAREPAGDLSQIKGLGPKLQALLAERGITDVAQIAALTPSDAETLDANLGAFKGRMARDRWIDQAKFLAACDRAGFEAEFGKLGG